MQRRFETAQNSAYSLKQIRIYLLLLVAVFFSFSSAMAQETPRRPKDMVVGRRISIKKQSQWIHEQFKENAEFTAQKTDVVSKKRKKLIREIEVLLTHRNLGKKERRNIKFRIAKLMLEDYYTEIGFAYQQLEERNAENKKSGVAVSTKIDDSKAMVSLDKSRRHYFDLLRDYPEEESRDQILYFLAITSLNKGLTQDAMEGFEALRTKFPKSRYVPDALVQLGDYYFDQSNYKKATLYYEQMIALDYKALLSYSVYKKGWCAYNSGKPDSALESFKWVILNEDKIAGSSPLRIKNEALNDIGLVFGDLKRLDEAKAFYQQFGNPIYRKGMEAIGALWQERGNYKLSNEVWKDLLSQDPLYVHNPRYELEIADSYRSQNQTEAALKQFFAPLPQYVGDSEWAKSNQTKEAQTHLTRWEEESRKFALVLHSTGRTTNNNHFLDLAKMAYESYLHYFPNAKEAANLRYQLATLQFKFQEYLKASDNFIIVAKASSDPKVKQESFLNAVNALGQEMNRERKNLGLAEVNSHSSQKVKEDTSTVTPYTKVEERFMDLASSYASQYPTAAEAPELSHELGYVQYLHHDFGKALKQFVKIVKNYPTRPSANTASFLILDILNHQQNYDVMIETCKQLLRQGPNDQNFKAQVATILRQSELKRIQGWEGKQEYETAANGYLNYAKTYGKEDRTLHETALYNAIGNFQKASLLSQTLTTQEDFLKTFPKSARAPEVLLAVAKIHEQMGLFAKSAREYEEFVKTSPKSSQAKAAMRLSGLLYWGAGMTRKAETTLASYAQTYPKDAKLVESDLAEIYDTAGMAQKQIAMLKTNLDETTLPPAEYFVRKANLIDLNAQRRGRLSSKDLTELAEFGDKHARAIKRNPAAIEAYAKLKLWANLTDESQFQRMRLTLPDAHLEKVLKAKLVLLNELESSYKKISKLGSPEWGLASIYKTAKLYAQLANDVEGAPVPKALSAAESDKYREGIKTSLVAPFRRKAKVLAETCMKQSEDLHILSRWSAKCFSMAAKLDPEKYQDIRTFYLPPLFMALITPEEGSVTPSGSMSSEPYPFESSFLFKNTDKQLSALKPLESVLVAEELGDLNEEQHRPTLFSYRLLADDQAKSVGRTIASEKPGGNGVASFAYLNSMRLANPRQAINVIQDALKRDPANLGLQNLLALTFLESDNIPAAKVMWMSMMTRTKNPSAIQNNLGVLAVLEGKEAKGAKLFAQSQQVDLNGVCATNLGFLALKYRNGSEALKYFNLAHSNGKVSAPLQIGQLVAMIQRGEQDSVRESLTELTKGFERDPYARLTASYYLIDKEHDYSTAQQILMDYAKDKQAETQEITFKRALHEAESLARNEENTAAMTMKPVEAGVAE